MVWQGVFPAVTTKFTADDVLDHAEMERCFALQIAAGVDGLIVCGSLGENMTLTRAEKIAILKTAKSVAGNRPVLMTIAECATAQAGDAAAAAEKAGADGLMVLPAIPYRSDARETMTHFRAVAAASDLPIMIYNNPVAYGVDVTPEMFAALADEPKFVALKESSDDIRRVSEIATLLGDRYALFTGVDNLALESLAMGAVGWVAGLVVAFPKETVAIWKLSQAGRWDEARTLYRWFRPLLDLDVSTKLVQNIKRAEMHALQSNDRCRAPRLSLTGAERDHVDAIIHHALETRPTLPVL